jgi:virginiamycin B lyase
VPTPRFARDPAIGPDGNIYITVMNGNKIARFDTKTHAFKEWDLAPGHRPHGLLVDKQGIVWTTGNGNGTLGRLDPATGQFTEFSTPSRGGGPHTLVIGNDGVIWFTMQSGNKIGRFDTKTSGPITEYPTSGGPYGLALDNAGNVWFCRMGDNKVGRLDPKSGQMTEISTGPGSLPRRIAAAPDGMLWVTQYGNGKLAKIDPAAAKVVKGLCVARRRRRTVRGKRRRGRHRLGQRNQHRYRGAAQSCHGRDAGREAAVQKCRHPQDDDRCQRSPLVHGQP